MLAQSNFPLLRIQCLLRGGGTYAYTSSYGGVSASSLDHHLRLYHTHTGERIDIVYRRGDVFLPEAEAELDHFLRDHRTGEVKHYDPRVFDILSQLTSAVGHPDAEIEIICGYRSSWSNEFLRSHSPGVARNSLHMQAHAIDIRIPGREHAGVARRGAGFFGAKAAFITTCDSTLCTWIQGTCGRGAMDARQMARLATNFLRKFSRSIPS